jgi:hypothetical protein
MPTTNTFYRIYRKQLFTHLHFGEFILTNMKDAFIRLMRLQNHQDGKGAQRVFE